jgi:hypothetical protein
MVEYFATFIAGLFLEGTAVFWTHYSERGRALIAASFSSVQALALVLGIGESVHDLKRAPFFVLGYGVGSYAAIKLKTSFKMCPRERRPAPTLGPHDRRRPQGPTF